MCELSWEFEKFCREFSPCPHSFAQGRNSDVDDESQQQQQQGVSLMVKTTELPREIVFFVCCKIFFFSFPSFLFRLENPSSLLLAGRAQSLPPCFKLRAPLSAGEWKAGKQFETSKEREIVLKTNKNIEILSFVRSSSSPWFYFFVFIISFSFFICFYCADMCWMFDVIHSLVHTGADKENLNALSHPFWWRCWLFPFRTTP